MRVLIDVRDKRGMRSHDADLFCEAHAREFLDRTYPFARWPEPWQHQERTWNASRTEQVIVRVIKDEPGVTRKVACLWCPPQPDDAPASDLQPAAEV